MSKQLIGAFIVAGVLAGVLAVGPVDASHNGTLEERRAAREAARAARDAERAAERAAREAQRVAEQAHQDAVENGTACDCQATLKYAKPSLTFSNGVLTLTPRVDVVIRTKGQPSAPGWSADVAYEGNASYASPDVAAPAPQTLAGSTTIAAGSCSNGTQRISGRDLGRIPLLGLTTGLVGDEQQLQGVVRLRSTLTGCGTLEEHREFRFDLREFGNLVIRGWRSV